MNTAYFKAWYNNHPIANQKRKLYLRKRYQATREFIIRAKARPCMDCKIQYNHWIMDFDHRNAKEKVLAVSALKRTGNLKRVQLEIAKCDLVCANCHRERTYRRMKKI